MKSIFVVCSAAVPGGKTKNPPGCCISERERGCRTKQHAFSMLASARVLQHVTIHTDPPASGGRYKRRTTF